MDTEETQSERLRWFYLE